MTPTAEVRVKPLSREKSMIPITAGPGDYNLLLDHLQDKSLTFDLDGIGKVKTLINGVWFGFNTPFPKFLLDKLPNNCGTNGWIIYGRCIDDTIAITRHIAPSLDYQYILQAWRNNACHFVAIYDVYSRKGGFVPIIEIDGQMITYIHDFPWLPIPIAKQIHDHLYPKPVQEPEPLVRSKYSPLTAVWENGAYMFKDLISNDRAQTVLCNMFEDESRTNEQVEAVVKFLFDKPHIVEPSELPFNYIQWLELSAERRTEIFNLTLAHIYSQFLGAIIDGMPLKKEHINVLLHLVRLSENFTKTVTMDIIDKELPHEMGNVIHYFNSSCCDIRLSTILDELGLPEFYFRGYGYDGHMSSISLMRGASDTKADVVTTY